MKFSKIVSHYDKENNIYKFTFYKYSILKYIKFFIHNNNIEIIEKLIDIYRATEYDEKNDIINSYKAVIEYENKIHYNLIIDAFQKIIDKEELVIFLEINDANMKLINYVEKLIFYEDF